MKGGCSGGALPTVLAVCPVGLASGTGVPVGSFRARLVITATRCGFGYELCLLLHFCDFRREFCLPPGGCGNEPPAFLGWFYIALVGSRSWLGDWLALGRVSLARLAGSLGSVSTCIFCYRGGVNQYLGSTRGCLARASRGAGKKRLPCSCFSVAFLWLFLESLGMAGLASLSDCVCHKFLAF